jgi:hypothetical protein
MVALARKLGQVLCVLAGLAAVLLVVSGNTTTGGVGALLGFGHLASPRVACSGYYAFLFALLTGRLSACTRALFVNRLDHTIVGSRPAVAHALRAE